MGAWFTPGGRSAGEGMMVQQREWGPAGYPQSGYGHQYPEGPPAQYDPVAHRQRIDGVPPQSQSQPHLVPWEQDRGYGPPQPVPQPGPGPVQPQFAPMP